MQKKKRKRKPIPYNSLNWMFNSLGLTFPLEEVSIKWIEQNFVSFWFNLGTRSWLWCSSNRENWDLDESSANHECWGALLNQQTSFRRPVRRRAAACFGSRGEWPDVKIGVWRLLLRTWRSKELKHRWVILQADITTAKHEGECLNQFKCVDIYRRTEQLALASVSTPRLHSPLLRISPMKLGYSLSMFHRHYLEHIIYNLSLKDSRLDNQWNTEWWKNTSEFSWIINTSSYFFHLKQ